MGIIPLFDFPKKPAIPSLRCLRQEYRITLQKVIAKVLHWSTFYKASDCFVFLAIDGTTVQYQYGLFIGNEVCGAIAINWMFTIKALSYSRQPDNWFFESRFVFESHNHFLLDRTWHDQLVSFVGKEAEACARVQPWHKRDATPSLLTMAAAAWILPWQQFYQNWRFPHSK